MGYPHPYFCQSAFLGALLRTLRIWVCCRDWGVYGFYGWGILTFSFRAKGPTGFGLVAGI